MALTVNSGVVDTEAVLADEKVVDMVDEFQLLDPDTSQFSTMLSHPKLGSAPATREKVNWLEDQYFPNLTSAAASGTSAVTSVTAASGEGAYVRAGDLIRNQTTGEAMKVVSVATDTLGVTRGVGATTAGAITSGDKLLIVSNAAAQNADVGTLKSLQRVLNYNYTQIHRHPFGMSGTDAEINTYGGGQVPGEMAKKAVEHKRSREATLFWGARSFTSASPNSIGTSGGAIEFIATNVFSSIGSLTKDVWETDIATVLQHGQQSAKVVFCAPKVAQAISGFSRDNWVRATPDENVYGVHVSAFVSGPYGTNLPIVVKQEWGAFPTSGYGGYAFVLDMSLVRLRTMVNRGTQLLRNRQSPGVDGVIHEYRTEETLQFAQEKAHGVFKGVTG